MNRKLTCQPACTIGTIG